MKESEPVVKPKKKKAKSNNNTNGNSKSKVANSKPKFLNSNNNNHHNQKSNGTNGTNHNSKTSSRPVSTAITTVNRTTGIGSTKVTKKRLKEIKDRVNSSKRSNKKTSPAKSSPSPRSKKRGNNKSSPELRPRRRASQSYFFKYQLARNPLKAEEEDLKLALLASLQQCGSSTSANSDSQDDQNDQRQPKTKKQQKQHQHLNNNQQHDHHMQRHLHNHQNNNTINFKQPKHEEQLQQVAKAPPKTYDEEYLKRYRPETEDFLTFICFRITAPNYNDKTNTESTADETNKDGIATNHHHHNTNHISNCNNNFTHTHTGNKTSDKMTSNDSHNLRRSCSPHKMTANNHVSNSSPNPVSPSNRRRPTRQSPRLASSNRKISESDNTAYDTISYEEDMKKASIALEDMAQEINSKDDIYNEIAQHSSDCVTRSTSPFKNNKHLVKGLMTREFAGGFADEEIIFESISNHKL